MSNVTDLTLFGGDLTVDADNITLTKNVVTPEFNVSAYNKDITATAVDVFVYDTSKDSDGGAWRSRTQDTSWYNETLNTATRGSRKEFPSVAVIVAETDTVTIYDGDDPDLPMWMVFPADAYITWASGSDTGTSCVSALNSKLFIGNSNGYGDCIVDFVSDDTRLVYNNNNYALTKRTVVDRNILESTEFPLYYAGGDGYNIVNNAINDVAMTVLPNAPIDADTGLPVPTIAVATDGGVSVIKDDGTVVDSSLTVAINSVGFTQNHSLIYNRTDYSSDIGDRTYVQLSIPTSDGFTADQEYSEHSVPRLNRVNNPDLVGMDDDNYAIGSGTYNYGFAHLYNNTANKADSLFTHITSNYNTGWMNGDIKLATLSDTDDTDVTGTEILSNTDFTSGTSPWVAVQASISADSNKLTITPNSAVNGGVYHTITTVVGETYVYEVKVLADASNLARMYAGTGNDINLDTKSNLASKIELGEGVHSITFVAAGTTTYIWLEVGGGTQQPTEFDDASVRLAEPDRSYNDKGLQIFGTVTKSAVATGADLVAYSGFSTSNYLEQPYNSSLGLSSTDYLTIMCWVKQASHNGTIQIIFASGVEASGEGRYLYTDAGVPLLDTYGGSTNNSTRNIADNTWHHLTAIYTPNGIGYMYIDGILDATPSLTSGYIDQSANSNVRIGLERNNTLPTNASISLLRVSNSIPTAEQIAKIYNDEKFLFQENAQATLYGTSDAVTALAYDDTTRLLHVGTSSGRSVFQGLRRVDNTTTAVVSTISASNSLIAED